MTCHHGIDPMNPWQAPCVLCVPIGSVTHFETTVTTPEGEKLFTFTAPRMPQFPTIEAQQQHIAENTVKWLQNEGYIKHTGKDGTHYPGEYKGLDIRVQPLK